MPKLTRIVDRIPVQDYPLRDGVQVLGRSVDSDIHFHDKLISEFHAEITVQDSPYMIGHKDVFIKDTNSRNGTFINGERKRQHRLKNGDNIKVGSQMLKFEDKERPTGEQRIVSKPDPEKA